MAVVGVGVALAAPAWADTAAEIDAGVEAARDKCAADVPGCETAATEAQGMLVFPAVTKGAIGIGGSMARAR
jgi:hypothetical protein